MVQSIAVLIAALVPCTPAPPAGKSTIASSDAMTSLQFMLKYLPVTVAEDNGVGNIFKEAKQARVQTLLEGQYTERNCILHSKTGDAESSYYDVAMTPNGLGQACTYDSGSAYSATVLHKVFAHNEVQCCNSCVATDGCVAATFQTSTDDHSGGFGPQSWEGFGIHLPDAPFPTTGGLTVDQLEEKYIARLGDHSVFDAFMDYSVTFYTYTLQPYIDAFKADGVPHFVGQWNADGASWYSLIFRVTGSTYVLELVSQVAPSGSGSLPKIEQRMSPARCAAFANSKTDFLQTASINRASADIDLIDDVYINKFKGSNSHTLKEGQVDRRCYVMGSGLFDVCFTQRTSDAAKDAIFSVADHENNLWAVHAGTMKDDPHTTDKMTDSHGGFGIPSAGMTALKSYFQSNDPFPITTKTRLAYACFQSYVIDPTGFSIQAGSPQSKIWPRCTSQENLV